jgi:hypothetical protein
LARLCSGETGVANWAVRSRSFFSPALWKFNLLHGKSSPIAGYNRQSEE